MTRPAAALLPLLCLLLAGCGDKPTVKPHNVRSDTLLAAVPRDHEDVPAHYLTGVRYGIAHLGGELTAGLAKDGDNVVLSPYSVYSALAMTYAGARGATAKELEDTVVGTGLGQAELHRALNAIDLQVQGIAGKGARVETANTLYVQPGFPARPAFLDTLARDYGSGLRIADFANDPPEAAKTVNAWVAGRTHDRITTLLPPEGLSRQTALLLVNAISLDAEWALPFEKSATGRAPFHAPGGDRQLDTMHQQSTFAYAHANGAQTVELPYAGDRLALDVVLPDEGQMPAVLRRFQQDPRPFTEGLDEQLVSLALPKLDLRSAFELKQPMAQLGLHRAFTQGQADLSGMGLKPGQLWIGTILHQATIRIDEAGTEAAAATAVGVEATSAPAPPKSIDMEVDRPFLFVLRDKQTGAALFTGLVSDPG